jgi:hypothetical protein
MIRTDHEPMDLAVTRWQAFGRDRLHVSDASELFGWLDLLTGDLHISSEDRRDGVRAAAEEWLAANPGVECRRGGRPAVVFIAKSDKGSVDLIGNQPGSTLSVISGDVDAEQRRHRGRIGERRTGHVLAALRYADPRWGVLHSVPVGERGGDIDHLLVGPQGVFCINTKHWAGAHVWVAGEHALVNGAGRSFLHDARFEAKRASERLSAATGINVDAHGVVVWVDAQGVTVKETRREVTVLALEELGSWLGAKPERLRPSEVVAVFSAAKRAQTWKQ